MLDQPTAVLVLPVTLELTVKLNHAVRHHVKMEDNVTMLVTHTFVSVRLVTQVPTAKSILAVHHLAKTMASVPMLVQPTSVIARQDILEQIVKPHHVQVNRV